MWKNKEKSEGLRGVGTIPSPYYALILLLNPLGNFICRHLLSVFDRWETWDLENQLCKTTPRGNKGTELGTEPKQSSSRVQ
jgi:hypothetical protein